MYETLTSVQGNEVECKTLKMYPIHIVRKLIAR